MDKMEWSQAKSIAARIYGDAEIDGDLGDDGDTKSDREKQDVGDSKSGVKTIKTLIETEDEELDRIIEDMLAVLPRVEEEYLVSGARLKCSLATKDIIFIDGVPFHTNKNGTSLLKVENRDKIGDMSKANICDCEKQKNIIPFGNCKAELSEDEKKMLKANAGARQEGKLTYYEAHASTLPDNMETAATICEGIYEVKNGTHSASKDFEGYAALWLNNSENIPAYNSIHQNDAANGIHFHMAGRLSKDNPANPYSTGCITIPVKDYVAFGKHVGFINEETDDNIGSDNIYGNAKSKLDFSKHTKAFEGYIVIDRQYYDDTEGYLKFNGSKGEE